MPQFLSSFIKSIKPYTAGEQPFDKKYIKLNTNENAYPPAPGVEEAVKSYQISKLKLYPDPNSLHLKTAISEKEGIAIENIFVGNGSDEVLAFCFPSFFERGQAKNVYFPDITYSFYPVYCNFFGINYKTLPLDCEFRINLSDYAQLDDSQGIIITNPNAPTGIAAPSSEIEKLLFKCPDKLIIVDEAYVDFFGDSTAKLTSFYPNLLVVKTFSKGYSLAGIRCGYALGHKDLISGLERCRDSFNSYPVDRLCEAAATAAIKAQDYYTQINNKIIKSRETLTAVLEDLGLRVLPSDSNFVFASHKAGGEYIYQSLKARGVLVRYFDKPRIKDFVRITIGTEEENSALIKELREILSSTDCL